MNKYIFFIFGLISIFLSCSNIVMGISQAYFIKWAEVAQTKFGWDKETIGSIIVSGEDVTKMKHQTRIIDNLYEEAYRENNCNCSCSL